VNPHFAQSGEETRLAVGENVVEPAIHGRGFIKVYLKAFNHDPRKIWNRPSRQMLVKGEIFTITVMALRPCGPASKSARKYFNADEK